MKRDGTSLHHSLKYAVCEALDAGVYVHGERIPSENTLASHYGVSRHVVRQALDRLVAEGRLRALQGAGYFVNDRRIVVQLPSFAHFTETMRLADKEARVELLSRELVSAPTKVEKLLKLRSSRQLVRIVRAGYIGSEPVAILEGYYTPRAGKVLLEANLDQGVYAVLEHHEIRPTVGENLLSVAYADGVDATRLGVPDGSAIVEVTSIALDEREKPIEYVRAAYRADRFAFRYSTRAPEVESTVKTRRR